MLWSALECSDCSGVLWLLWLLWPLWSCRCWWNWLPAVTECRASNIKGRCCNFMLQHLPFISHNWQLAIYMWETARRLYKRRRCSTPSWTLNLYFFSYFLPVSQLGPHIFPLLVSSYLFSASIDWYLVMSKGFGGRSRLREWETGETEIGNHWLAT